MESSLHAREVVGVHDFVLLEKYNSEDAFLDNLKKRFTVDMIYVRDIKFIAL
jgi:myosin I